MSRYNCGEVNNNCLHRLHVIKLDVTSDIDVKAAFDYVQSHQQNEGRNPCCVNMWLSI